ncbi:hypothetical protein THRCLA_05556 [Thraustotheca clavata]|uniref:DUF7802 domain-containing protein n=1 Tax=Thraustotheca clavata TaxID=74557 RepID=A0A1V9ZVL5_9STRA|nr:hypothetical protein THRCLA_05556 [Thraustotheca clavata]
MDDDRMDLYALNRAIDDEGTNNSQAGSDSMAYINFPTDDDGSSYDGLDISDNSDQTALYQGVTIGAGCLVLLLLLEAGCMSMVSTIISGNSPLQLVYDNVALFLMEMVTYACFFLLYLHAQGSPRRTKITMATIVLYNLLLLSLGQYNEENTITWYAQSSIMLGNGHLPLYIVVLYSMLYYVAYITTCRLHLQDYASAFTFTLIVVVLAFPIELLGPKFIFWTFHDTEPTLNDRFLSVPIAVLLAHIASAFAFYSCYAGVIALGLAGHTYIPEKAILEHVYPVIAVTLAIPFSVLYFTLLFHLLTELLLIEPNIVLLAFITLFVGIIWACDRLGGDLDPPQIPPWVYDGEWTLVWYDHAIVQAVCLYVLLTFVLVLSVNPTRLTSLSFHQQIGDCSIQTSYTSLLATTQTRFKYLCRADYDEEFTFCNVPFSRLHTYEPWYAVCGRRYPHKTFPNYFVCLLISFVTTLIGFRAAYSNVRPAFAQRFLPQKAA